MGNNDDAAASRPGGSRAGQVALVTGGSAGLGLAIAAALARAASAVVLASRSAGRCQQAAARLSAETGRTVQGHGCDPTELTGAALLLTDRAAGYLTGAVLPVDGGWTAH